MPIVFLIGVIIGVPLLIFHYREHGKVAAKDHAEDLSQMPEWFTRPAPRGNPRGELERQSLANWRTEQIEPVRQRLAELQERGNYTQADIDELNHRVSVIENWRMLPHGAPVSLRSKEISVMHRRAAKIDAQRKTDERNQWLENHGGVAQDFPVVVQALNGMAEARLRVYDGSKHIHLSSGDTDIVNTPLASLTQLLLTFNNVVTGTGNTAFGFQYRRSNGDLQSYMCFVCYKGQSADSRSRKRAAAILNALQMEYKHATNGRELNITGVYIGNDGSVNVPDEDACEEVLDIPSADHVKDS